jgi:hypothetical protein
MGRLAENHTIHLVGIIDEVESETDASVFGLAIHGIILTHSDFIAHSVLTHKNLLSLHGQKTQDEEQLHT